MSIGNFDGTIALWDIAAKTRRASLVDFTGPAFLGVSSVAFSPDGVCLAGVDQPEVQRHSNGNVSTTIWEVATRKRAATLTDPGVFGVNKAVFSPKGAVLARVSGNRLDQLTQRLRTFRDRGDLPPDCDPTAPAWLLMTVVKGPGVQAASGGPREELLAVADQMMACFPPARPGAVSRANTSAWQRPLARAPRRRSAAHESPVTLLRGARGGSSVRTGRGCMI